MPNTKITSEQQALVKKLYSQEKSASQIAKELSLTLSQVYDSLIRQKIERRKTSEQSRIRFANKPLSFVYKSRLSYKEQKLETAALMLYFGEGAKTGFTVDFANSHPDIIKIFLKYLKTICQVKEQRIKFYLYCFSDQNSAKLIKWWAKNLKVKPSAFTKPYVREVKQNSLRIMQYGVLHVRYSDKKLLAKILGLIDQTTQKLLK